MFVTVMYKDGKVGMVDAHQIDELIRTKKITKFMRSEGWVSVGKDPVRKSHENRKGAERRQTFRRTK